MATVTVPRILTDLEAHVRGAGRRAMTVAMAETSAAIAASPLMPVNLGLLRRSVSVTDVVEEADRVIARIVVTGPAAAYGVTLEFSRRPGARGPSFRHLFLAPGGTSLRNDWRGGWVNRKLRAGVENLASEIQAAQAARGRKVTRENAERHAAFVIARAIARSIHAKGIAARGFAKSQAPLVPERFRAAFFEDLRANGVIGGGK